MRALILTILVAFVPIWIGRGRTMADWQPPPLQATQDAGLVQSHRRVADRQVAPGTPPVIPRDWVARISARVRQVSRRAGRPAEIFGVIFTREGKIALLLAVFPASAERTPNRAGFSHLVVAARYDRREGKLDLSPPGRSGGPDGFELFGIDQLPLVCRELIPLRRLQRAFTAQGLPYTFDASVISADGGRQWKWQVSSIEDERPTILFAMTYDPITRELQVVPIKDRGIAGKIRRAVAAAGLILRWDRHR